MSGARYESLCRNIDNMAHWKAAAICAVCAAKVGPLVARLGLPDTWRVVEECLEYAWRNIGHPANSQAGVTLVEALESTPEWQCEDNAFLPFAVTEVLDFVKSAVLAAAAPLSAREHAKGSLDALVGISSSYDFAAKKFPAYGTTKGSNYGLEAREEKSQERLVTFLQGVDGASQNVIDVLRHEAKEIADVFGLLLPMVCYSLLSSSGGGHPPAEKS